MISVNRRFHNFALFIRQKTRSIRAIEIFQQLTALVPCNLLAFIDLPLSRT